MPKGGRMGSFPRLPVLGGGEVSPLMTQHTPNIRSLTTIRLTPVGSECPSAIEVSISELLTYSQQLGFTRLRLKGQRTLDVHETTEGIDRLIRRAVSL